MLEFKTIDELKQRLMPAIRMRQDALKKENIDVTTDDIWNYFVSMWKKNNNLTLADLVDDLLNKKIR